MDLQASVGSSLVAIAPRCRACDLVVCSCFSTGLALRDWSLSDQGIQAGIAQVGVSGQNWLETLHFFGNIHQEERIREIFVDKRQQQQLPAPRSSDQPRKPYERFREKQFVCDLCEQSFTLKQNVQQHIVNFHGLDRSSPDRESFERRMRRFQCMKCLKIFKSEDVALKHFEKAHDKPVKMEKKEHKCEDCEKVYLTKTQLEEHVSIVHLNVRKFICTQCPASFGRRGGLRRHVEMVHVGKTYKCTYEGCEHPGYKCSKALAAHVRAVHTGERPYECSQCERAFVRKNDLKVHEATHSRIVDLRCQYCGAAFRRDNYLKKHYRVCEKKNRRRIAHPGKEPRNRSPKKEEPASEENAALARERVYEGMTLRAKPRRRVIY
ncbi:hypothetical protein L596_026900 [Steinernema carpocapsae]|uniref:C2H2-type domain-containing protein n=1 Tax=Steinernema carpocapsae TaxID=34508 RepID=A0A4U5M2V8_STECR|nr:hypothetical protein L596_026900 [Steinernema carpocapsae]